MNPIDELILAAKDVMQIARRDNWHTTKGKRVLVELMEKHIAAAEQWRKGMSCDGCEVADEILGRGQGLMICLRCKRNPNLHDSYTKKEHQ